MRCTGYGIYYEAPETAVGERLRARQRRRGTLRA